MKKSQIKLSLTTLVVVFVLSLVSCGGGGANWAEGTWERSSGVVSFTVEDGELDYPQAKISGVKPSTSNANKMVWKTKATLGDAIITLKKTSENEAKLITEIGEASDEYTFTKKK